MTKFLCVQHTYNGIQAALFEDYNLIDKVFEDKKRASKYFVTCISTLLKNNNLSLSDLSFIATNKGPGPFTTLRVVLASINGLAFAIKKPIIGIDGLDAILKEHESGDLITVALLDACSKDVYFGISCENIDLNLIQENRGYKNISAILEDIKNLQANNLLAKNSLVNKKIHFIGNGSQKYQDQIIELFGDMAIFDEIIPEVCSVEAVGKMAFDQWIKKDGLVEQVLPIYLKSMAINKSV